MRNAQCVVTNCARAYALLRNVIVLRMPEDVLTLSTPSALTKSEWIWALNAAVDAALQRRERVRQSVSRAVTSPRCMYARVLYCMGLCE